MKPLKIAIVGAGAQCKENILPSLLLLQGIEIVAICDLETERTEYAASFIKDVQIFTDVVAMVKAIELDAVIAVCPPQAHQAIASLVIPRGISVFVEKPPCTNIDELKALITLSEKHGVNTGVGMNFRFANPIQQLSKISSDDTFGKIAHIQLNHYAAKPKTPLWGLSSTLRSFLLAQTIHTIDLAVLFGGTVKKVTTDVQKEGDSLIVEINITFESGATSSILTGTMFPYFEFDMKLVSTKSTMVQLDNLWNITLHEVGREKRWRGLWQPGPLESGYGRSGYEGELQNFFDSIREGKEFEANFKSILPTYEIIEKVCSIETLDVSKSVTSLEEAI